MHNPADHRPEDAPPRTCQSPRRPRLGHAPHHPTIVRPVVFSPARLRAWRHARTLDHATLATAADTTAAVVQACEQGLADPTPDMITAWSARLDCRPDQLRSTTPTDPAEYWRAAHQAMPRMSAEDLAVVAHLFTRTTGRTNRRTSGPDQAVRGDRHA